MKSHLISALFIATLLSAPDPIAQETAATAPRGVNHTEADEPWMYPAEVPASPTIEQVNSLSRKIGFMEFLGVRIFTSNTRAVPAEVTSFEVIVKWYADKIGETQLSNSLERFANTGVSGPGVGIFKTASMMSSTHLTYRFTSEQKQITILHAEENGDVVTISLLGLDRETSIQVLRHHPNPSSVRRQNRMRLLPLRPKD